MDIDLSTDSEIFEYLKKSLSLSRFKHSQAVSRLAAKLGKIYGWSPDQAARAGLLHDVAKEWPPRKLLSYAKRYQVKVPSLGFMTEKSPNLLHAYVGAQFVKNKGWITSKISLKAISSHTLASMSMSIPEKILYVADLSSPDRRFKQARAIRALAFKSLDEAFRESVNVKISIQQKCNRPIHPLAVKVWRKYG